MAATPETLRPEDGAQMLALARQMDEQTGGKAGAKRALTRAFERSPVLLAGGPAAPLVLPSTDTGVLVAFTDEEAAEAWAAERHPAAPPVDWGLIPAPPDHRAGRSAWLDRLEEVGAAIVSVNPSGPLSFLVHHQELTEWRSLFRRSTSDAGPAPWLDLQERAQERLRLKGMMERLADVVASGQLASMEALDPELKTRHAFSSAAISTEVQFLLDRWRLHFQQYYEAIYEMTWVSTMRARFGDPWRAVDGLLEAADHIRRLNDEGVEDPEHPGFLEHYWKYVLKTLPVMAIPYREAERAALVENQPTFAPPRRRRAPQQ